MQCVAGSRNKAKSVTCSGPIGEGTRDEANALLVCEHASSSQIGSQSCYISIVKCTLRLRLHLLRRCNILIRATGPRSSCKMIAAKKN